MRSSAQGFQAVLGRYWGFARLPAEWDRELFTRGSGAITRRPDRQPDDTAALGRKPASVGRWNSCREKVLLNDWFFRKCCADLPCAITRCGIKRQGPEKTRNPVFEVQETRATWMSRSPGDSPRHETDPLDENE